MSIELLILFSIIVFFTSIIHTTIGFGLLLVATPLMALLTDMQTAIIYLLLPSLVVNVTSIISGGSFIKAFKRFWPLAFLSTIGTALGTQILIEFHSEIFKTLLAFTILFYLFSNKLNINYSWIQKKPKFAQGFFGIAAGLVGGLTNAMGPVLIIYSIEIKHTKNELIQASNLCFLFGKIIQLILFSINGALSSEDLINSSFMTPIVLIAFFIGLKIKNRIDAKLYKRIIKYLLIIISASLIFQSLF